MVLEAPGRSCLAMGEIASIAAKIVAEHSAATFRLAALEKIGGLDAECFGDPSYDVHPCRHIGAFNRTDITRTQLRFLGKRFLRPLPGVTQATDIRRYDLLNFHAGMEAESRTFIPGTNVPIRRRPCYARPLPNL
ncbi:hypothetical protein [Methylocystis sp. S23]|jgi:hypothetical protein